MPGQTYRPKACDDYAAVKDMPAPPAMSGGEVNPDFQAFYDWRGEALNTCIADPGGMDYLQAAQQEVLPEADYGWDDGGAGVSVDETVSVATDGLGFERGSGSSDYDLYSGDVTTTQEFLANGNGQRAYATTQSTGVGGLASRKQAWLAAALAAGATRDEASILVAQLMQETFRGSGHDTTKDGYRDGSRNFSNLNLNEDMLYNYGGMGDMYDGSRSALNDDGQMEVVAAAALNVMRDYGVDAYLAFTREGRRGLTNPGQDAEMFAASIRDTASRLANDDTASTDSTRYAHKIGHI